MHIKLNQYLRNNELEIEFKFKLTDSNPNKTFKEHPESIF